MDDPRLLIGGAAAPATPPTMARDQAVIGWLATRPALPDLTRDLLIDVLIFWESLAPLPAVTAEPDAGTDVGEFLRSVARQLSAHPFHPGDHQTQMVLADLHCLPGLAWYSLLDPDSARASRCRWEQHRDGVVQLRVLETDTAVTLRWRTGAANAASSTSRCHCSPAPGRAPCLLGDGAGPGAQRPVWAPKP